VSHSPQVFLDACVFIAAAASPQGGSALVLELCKRRRVQPITTQSILQEAERNISLKFDRQVLLRFYQDIANTNLRVAKPAGAKEIALCSGIIDPKDVHVLAAAIGSRATILLTLDRNHFMTPSLRQANLGLLIQTPGALLRQWVD